MIEKRVCAHCIFYCNGYCKRFKYRRCEPYNVCNAFIENKEDTLSPPPLETVKVCGTCSHFCLIGRECLYNKMSGRNHPAVLAKACEYYDEI